MAGPGEDDPLVVVPAGADRPALVWRFSSPRLVVASAALGGGIGLRSSVLNIEVEKDYAPDDVIADLSARAEALGGATDAVVLCTAANVGEVTSSVDGPVRVWATVGLTHPTWAAADDDVVAAPTVGTINVVAVLEDRLEVGALVNSVATATEAKAQALLDAGVPGTGTATDAVCIVCPAEGPEEPYGGPRSRVGAALARAVCTAVSEGTARWPSR